MANFLKLFLGTKSDRDIKSLNPILQKCLEVYPPISQLSNDGLRAKTQEFRQRIFDYIREDEEQMALLKEKAENDETVSIDEKEEIYLEIDHIEKKIYEKTQEVLNDILPEAFAVVKETAKRFADHDKVEVTATPMDGDLAARFESVNIVGDKAFYDSTWMAGGTKIRWDMVHYDVQLIGGIVLHQGKISEMATGEGKTLVATLPVYLNALPGKGVHIVTVNDYLARRDSEWMGMLFLFHGLTVDCIDRHEPNSESRKKAYLADITYGTNNEFGFDYLRDNMTRSPEELVQRKHNYAIVDEVDSVLIDDARTPLIISGPTPKGENQLFEDFKPNVQKVYNAQKNLVTNMLADAKKLLSQEPLSSENEKQGGVLLLRAHHGLPKNKALIKFLSEPGMRALLQKTENFYMQEQSKNMHIIDDELFFVIDEKNNSVDLTEKGIDLITSGTDDVRFFILPDIGNEIAELEKQNLSDNDRLLRKNEMLQEYEVKSERVHTVTQLLKAYSLFEIDVDYVIIDNKIKIVDEQTGRIMEGRRWSDGLHQAVEAKENVKIEAATQTYATITLQ
ncbi:MAG TPA: preprotein translocase subunit SecA, partial [Bacteroidales bacterium]|nr:preprotein translocase subunit SecA [Bacteroidales bacterium]